MRKIFTLSFILLFVSGVFAQKREAVIKKIEGEMATPVIDGDVDDVWDQANMYNIDQNFQSELPTLPALNPQTETVWKALYDQDGMYILLIVKDDAYYPSWREGGNSWELDKPELYFDVNYVLEDGGGCSGNPNGSGHYQVDVAMTEANHLGGEQVNSDWGVRYAFKVDDPNYVAEYFVPFSWLNNGEGGPIDIEGEVGFDVTIIDRDPGDAARKRSVWNNVGAINESWANMDDAGIITFEGAEVIYVDEINISVDGDITADNQTLQINTEVIPENATNKTAKYVILEGTTARVSISSTGLITPITDGVLIVGATDATDYLKPEDNAITINISGQVVELHEVSIVKNGYMNMVEENGMPTSWGQWVDGDTYGTMPTVVEGVAVLNSTGAHESENWHYQFNQSNLKGMADIPYVVSFVAWADNDRNICFDFEDTSGNDYNRYGAAGTRGSEWSGNGRSEWTFPITTTATRYTFDVTFDQMVANTVQKIQYMISQDVGTVYLDSITVVSEDDLGLIGTSAKLLGLEKFDVYPNPANDKLHINLSTPNLKVVIYNSLGVVMEEAEVMGTQHVFDVSRYAPGMYFVKAKNTVVKFIK